jgi:hypothetical protein
MGERAQTRTDHLRQIVRYLGWRPVGMPSGKSSMSSCWPGRWSTIPQVAVHLACEFLISERWCAPGWCTCSRSVGCSVPGEQSQPAEHCDRDQVQQSEQHGPRSCHEHLESTKPQVTTLVMGFGTLQAQRVGSQRSHVVAG